MKIFDKKISIPVLNVHLSLVLFLLLFVNVILKFVFINSLPLEGDEPFSVFFSQVTFPELFAMIQTENNPPLHFILLNIWVKIFGISPISVRFISYLFSCFTVVYIYKIGKIFFTNHVAILASIFFTFSSLNMLFSHEARVYSIFGFLTAASFYYFLLSINTNSRIAYFIKLTICNALLIYAHFFGFFVLFIQAIILLLLYKQVSIKKFIYSYIGILLLYAPYLVIFINRLLYSTTKGTWVSPPTNVSAMYYMLWRFCNAPLTTVLFLIIMLLAFAYYLLKDKCKRINFQTKVVLIWAFVPFVLMYLLSYKVPMYVDRYLVYVSIGFYFVFAISIDYFKDIFKSNYVYFFSTCIVIIFIATFNPIQEIEKRKANEVVERVNEVKRSNPNTVVIMSPDYTFRTFTYYYNLNYFINYNNTLTLLQKEKIFAVNNLSQIPDSILNSHADIFFIDNWASLVDTSLSIKKYINRQICPQNSINEFEIGGTKITYLKY